MKAKTRNSPAQIAEMFDNLAPHYDFLNHFFSLKIDKLWRKKVVRLLADIKNPVILDVATGTGDLAIELTQLKPILVYGVDISEKMLEKATLKIVKKNLQTIIFTTEAPVEQLPFEDNFFDAVTVAFGVRNFDDLEKGLNQIYRVTKQHGRAIILEFSMPANILVKPLYRFYLKKIMPFLGGIISGNRKAYKYLAASVINFSENVKLDKLLLQSGFKTVKIIKLHCGIAKIYLSQK